MRSVLVFDGDCGFCTSAVRFANRWLRLDADLLVWQLTDLDGLGLTAQACSEAVQYRDRSGRWTAGGRAVNSAIRDARKPWSSLGWLPGLRGLVDRCYVLVAANRHRLPGGTPACRIGWDSPT